MSKKQTKIICTLGPSSDSVTEITKLAEAGMDIARLNMSHGSYKHHEMMIKNIREVSHTRGKKIDILVDLQGPKIRIEKLPEPITIKKGEKINLSTDKKYGIPVTHKHLLKDMKKGDRIRIDDGTMEVLVTAKTKTHLICKVVIGGTITSGRGLNFPTTTISQPAITEKDKQDLKFALKHKPDFIALSFVKSAKDIKDLRKLMPKPVPIIAKIERHEALDHLEEIINESDGVMVARGDLGADLPPEQVPIIQKKILTLADILGKPTITATQVLYSMIENPTPTRAEISDAANAIFDNTDAIMLSNETSVGKYPFRAARVLKKVAIAVEKEMKKHFSESDL